MKQKIVAKPMPDETPDTVEGRIKSVREMLGMSQREFAASIDINRCRFANVENGMMVKASTKEPIIEAISETHGISEEWLRTGTGSYKQEDAPLKSVYFMAEGTDFQHKFMALLGSFSAEQWQLLHEAVAASDN